MSPEVAERAPIALDVQMIPTEQLFESTMNTRRHYDAATMAELEASIRQVGVLTPLIARPTFAMASPDDQAYELAAGHRRYRAAKAAGIAVVPVRVMALDDAAFRHVLIIENLQRQDIHPLDEADGYHALMEADKAYTVEAIAAKVGKSTSYVYQRLKLTTLIPQVREAWDADEITAAHAVRLARLTPAQQKDALKECWHPLFGKSEGGPKAEPAPLSQLDHWIEKHVQVAPVAPETAYYFPEVAEQLAAEEEPAKLLQLSESHMPGADLGTKQHGILGQGRWKAITGKSGRCANTAKGVVVHGGPMRILEVCATKGCPKHFPVQKRAPAGKSSASAKQSNPWAEENRKREEARAAWDALKPEAWKAFAAHVAGLKVTPELVLTVIGAHRMREIERVTGALTVENLGQVMALSTIETWNRDGFLRSVKPFKFNLGQVEKKSVAKATPAKSKAAKKR